MTGTAPRATGPPSSARTGGPPPPGAVPPSPPRLPEVWSRRHDLPGLPWSIAKGLAKGALLLFFVVALPVELLYTVFSGPEVLLHHSFSITLLIVGGGALAVTSAGFTAFQTTRAYGFFRLANRVSKLVYQFVLATLAVVTVGPYAITVAEGTFDFAARLNFADIFYLFMIPTALAAASAFVTFYEDLRHPGERLPWDFPISRRTRRRREREMAEYLRLPPP
jgi:hypothetical protein